MSNTVITGRILLQLVGTVAGLAVIIVVRVFFIIPILILNYLFKMIKK